jgi:protein-S-isoprenylcysteine O-methyltransferase Ste14
MGFLELKVPPPVVTAAIAVAMYLTRKWMPDPHFDFPARVPIAVIVAAAGIATDFAGLWTFRRHRTTVNPLQPGKAATLVADGVYRWTRNPMYLGLLLILTSWAIWLSTMVSLLGLPLLAIYLARFQILPEERVLRAKFGSDWTDYERHVRRWL